MTAEVLNILHAVLLIGSDKEFHVVARLYIQLFECPEHIHDADRRTLIVICTSPNEVVIHLFRDKRRGMLPACSGWNHIQMTPDSDFILR